MGGLSVPHDGLNAAFHNSYTTSHTMNSPKSSFLFSAQLYKSLFASAILQSSNNSSDGNLDKMVSSPFPRNLLFSCGDKNNHSVYNSDNLDDRNTKTPIHIITNTNSEVLFILFKLILIRK